MTDTNDMFLETELSRPAVFISRLKLLSTRKSVSRLIMLCRTETESWYVSEAKLSRL